jgi:hypothetical protein
MNTDKSARTPRKHEERVVGHVSGWKEHMGVCVCGQPWPCSPSQESPVGESNKVKRYWTDMDQAVDFGDEEYEPTFRCKLSVSADDFDALQAERDMYRTSADNLALDKLGLQSQLAHLTQQRDAIQLSEHRLTAALKAIRATLPHIDGNRMSIHNMLFVIDAALTPAQEAQT